jgi:hypothetical protein
MKKFFIILTLMLFVVLGSKAQTYSGTGPLTFSTPAGATNIQWYKDGTLIAGQTASTYATSTVGTYYALYDAAAGCLGVKTEIAILVSNCAASNGLPVTLNAATAGSITGYQWYNQSGIIASATSASYVATTGGSYYVEYAQAAGCNSTSEKYYVFVLDCPCTAGTVAPTLSATTKSNVCPTTTADISSLVSSTCPSGSSLEWHNVSTGFSASTIVTATSLGAGTYYPVCHDVTNTCYSPAPATGVTVTITTCASPLSITQPPVITKSVSTPVTGIAPTDLIPTGGTGAITYSNGSTDPLCVAPVGANPLPATSNLTVSSVGAYSYTTPATAGKYYFCVKVCDSASPTLDCKMATYTVTVTAPSCIVVGSAIPGLKN